MKKKKKSKKSGGTSADDDEDKFVPIMQDFYKKAEKEVKQLRKLHEESMANVKALANFYGEEVKKDIKFEEFFGIFNKFRDSFIENINKIKDIELKAEKEEKKRKAEDDKKKRKEEMKKKKQEEKDRKRQLRERKNKKSRRNLETPDANSADQDESKEKDPATQKKTDNIIDEFSDTSKYLAKLRRNNRKGGKNKMGNNRKSMYFKTKRNLLEPDQPAELEEEEKENKDEKDKDEDKDDDKDDDNDKGKGDEKDDGDDKDDGDEKDEIDDDRRSETINLDEM